MSEPDAPADWPAARRLARGGSRTFGQMEEEAMQAAGELPPAAPLPAPAVPAWPEIDEDEAAAALAADLPNEEDTADGR